MKIIPGVLGLAAIGGFLYAHKRRGGELTLSSMKQTAQVLYMGARMKAQSMMKDMNKQVASTNGQTSTTRANGSSASPAMH
ncbi:MAG TPA: hypothetical protein VGC41_26335 [Kofleriaceae bacterium]